MKDDFVFEDEAITEQDEETLREIRSGVGEEERLDPVTGRADKKGQKSALNKRKLSKYEMDELFLDF